MAATRGIRRSCVAVLALSCACAFDASGNSRGLGVLEPADDDPLDDGDGDGDGVDPDPEPEPEPEPGDDGATRTDDGASADGPADDGAEGTDDGGADDSVLETGAHDEAGTTDDGGLEEAGGTTDDGGANEGGETDDGSAIDCPVDVLELHWAESAELGGPMELLVAASAISDPEVAVSGVAESGTATFSLHFDCAGEYAVWGLVWDYYPGAYATDDPDSYYVGVGGPEPTWRYGCQTGEESSGLSWQRLESLDDQPCDTTPLVLSVVDGADVELTFRNREAGSMSEVAGIAAIVVSNDPDADPYDLYAPY
jgi:hypothetical protein